MLDRLIVWWARVRFRDELTREFWDKKAAPGKDTKEDGA